MEDRRWFVNTSEVWYRDTLAPEDRADVLFGGVTADGHHGAVRMRWVRIAGEPVPQLRAFDDAWALLAEFADVFEALAAVDDQSIDQHRFCEILGALGFADRTERVLDGEAVGLGS